MKTLLILGAIGYCVLALLLFIRLIKGPTAADRILAADQIDTSNNFARPREDRFAEIAFDAGAGGAPRPDSAGRAARCGRTT